ncbi:MAG: glutathione synthase [Ilumatobacter sp.]|nr:glutathione synthase [Ilumatobacter sp.]
MDIVIIMDGPETVDPATDTSLGLMLAAQEREHVVWHCTASDLEWIDGHPRARARRAHADEREANPLRLGDIEDIDLTAVDVVLIRTDPPFDVTYLHMTLLLDHLTGQTLVVNAPRGLRDANEKLYAHRFNDLVPATIVTSDAERIVAFTRAHGTAVAKPIEGHGGRNVMALRADDSNLPSIIDTLTLRGQTPVLVQRYLDVATTGDKRILLLDGEPLGVIQRFPTDDDFRANICVGGRVATCDLDDDDRRIIDRLRPTLRADGLYLVGIDVIEGHLSEVNVTSPTGIRQLGALTGTRPDIAVIRWLERTVIESS